MDIIEPGIYEISLGDFKNGIFENNQDIYLQDNLTGTIHDFTIGSYSFNINVGNDINNRFVVLFRNDVLVISDEMDNNNLIISNQNNSIQCLMSNEKIINSLKAYDVLGKLVIDKNPNQSNFTINTNLDTGTVLFIKATLENG
ncbi:MAG: hypothetical protein V3U80_02355 [Flavobacteriaceae bacterium]